MRSARSFLSWLPLALVLSLIVFGAGREARAQEPELAVPTFTISAPATVLKSDSRPFGLTIEPIRHVTADSQYFYRSAEGLQSLKDLGVTTLLYTVDRNNWRALYDDMNGSPQPPPSGITPQEVVGIAQSIGAELVPILNVTVQCEHTGGEGAPYTSENMTCARATLQDAIALIKYLKTETATKGVLFKRVVMGLEPYAGCTYWTKGINCTVDNPPGQHRIGLPAEEYVRVINKWVPKIHKLDKNLEIGAQLSPNAYYCQTDCNREWTQAVLQDAGKNIDFVLMHQYFRTPSPGAVDLASAQKYSYYQNQTDINLRKRGATGMPSKMRKDLLKWAPAGKGKMPIWYAEMNASGPLDDAVDGEQAAQYRRALYSGMALGELYLDMLAPVNVSGARNPGGTRVLQHHLFASTTFIAAYQPPNSDPQVMVKTPGWHILSMLKPFTGKAWQTVQATNVPTNGTGRANIVAYAARSGKKLTLAFFNHDNSQTYTIDAKLTDMKVKKGTVTRIGDQAVSFLSQNNSIAPDAIVPQSAPLDVGQIKAWGLDNFALPPHSVTVLDLTVN